MRRSATHEKGRATLETSPLIVFVHVPKTAGSSVNYFLAKNCPNGQLHMESVLGTPEFSSLAQQADWLSGHLYPQQFVAELAGLTRPIRWVSVVREPRQRLLSSLNWLRFIWEIGPEYWLHLAEHDRQLVLDFKSVDLCKDDQIIAYLEKYSIYYKNILAQVIMDMPGSFSLDALSDADIIERLNFYEFVAWEETLGELFHHLCPGAATFDVRENVSRYHFDVSTFDTPDIRAYLSEYLDADYRVYELVKKTFGDTSAAVADIVAAK